MTSLLYASARFRRYQIDIVCYVKLLLIKTFAFSRHVLTPIYSATYRPGEATKEMVFGIICWFSSVQRVG